ncbi:uncharacterized protein PGTG_15463 [Puccinia graminis f. sp. tritici CRL 75-36-700-3]|uniref:Uncharacterized protein n=1 Tax=Puccinia graminis f. sp. tritici (strain CRL 75-36-700-3 / race SCCL) TaxID=418459 RepID=E3KYK7_PUCGT|nr:uncharacterized protein PGTG_15463 [Puccinia graminis f. sp. tritici CRL 75-36-700-3]EFP89284.1 hypothetical protein PGTG_15463 [Puccinia graminis f. sp. tritici CRL 75-36-700-3]
MAAACGNTNFTQAPFPFSHGNGLGADRGKASPFSPGNMNGLGVAYICTHRPKRPRACGAHWLTRSVGPVYGIGRRPRGLMQAILRFVNASLPFHDLAGYRDSP